MGCETPMVVVLDRLLIELRRRLINSTQVQIVMSANYINLHVISMIKALLEVLRSIH